MTSEPTIRTEPDLKASGRSSRRFRAAMQPQDTAVSLGRAHAIAAGQVR